MRITSSNDMFSVDNVPVPNSLSSLSIENVSSLGIANGFIGTQNDAENYSSYYHTLSCP